MRNTSIKLCSLALFAGIFGTFLRWLQTMSGFETETGLSIPHAPISYVVLAYIIGYGILLYVLLRPLKNMSAPETYPNSLIVGGRLLPLFAVGAGILMGLGGAVSVVLSLFNKNVFQLITGILAIISAPFMLSFIKGASGFGAKKRGRVCCSMITIFICFWLIATYKYNASDPVLWNFAPRLLAVSALLLAMYFISGFAFVTGKHMPTLFFSLFGAFLGLFTLTESYPIGDRLIMLALSLFVLSCSFGLICNISSSPLPAGDAEETEPESPAESEE